MIPSVRPSISTSIFAAICRHFRTFPCISVIIPASFHRNDPHVTISTSAPFPQPPRPSLGSNTETPFPASRQRYGKNEPIVLTNNSLSHPKINIF